MLNLLSAMLSKKAYALMSLGKHSELRADDTLDKMDVDDLGVSSKGTLDISVGYTFTSSRRINRTARGKYSSTKNFDRIYQELTRLNQGEPFIDRYFETLFKGKFEADIRKRTRSFLLSIEQEREDLLASQKLNKDGSFDKRTKAYKNLKNFNVWKDAKETQEFDQLSMDIKRHIQQCLATGRITLRYSLKPNTEKRRKKLGLTPIRVFFATGQLIDNLVISYTASLKKAG